MGWGSSKEDIEDRKQENKPEPEPPPPPPPPPPAEPSGEQK